MKEVLTKVKNTINKLPFNNMAAKVPFLARAAKYANYAFCVLVVIVLLSFLFGGGEDKYVSMVKNGTFYDYPDVTVGDMVKVALDDLSWESFVADDGNRYVNATGIMEGSELLLQFRIKGDTFELNALECDGEATTQYERNVLLEAMHYAATN